jgi:hypothetical protein
MSLLIAGGPWHRASTRSLSKPTTFEEIERMLGHYPRWICCALVVFVLSACGGGDSDAQAGAGGAGSNGLDGSYAIQLTPKTRSSGCRGGELDGTSASLDVEAPKAYLTGWKLTSLDEGPSCTLVGSIAASGQLSLGCDGYDASTSASTSVEGEISGGVVIATASATLVRESGDECSATFRVTSD